MDKILRALFLCIVSTSLVGCDLPFSKSSDNNEEIVEYHDHTFDETSYIGNDKYHLHPLTCEHAEEAKEAFMSWPVKSFEEFASPYMYQYGFMGSYSYNVNVHDYYDTSIQLETKALDNDLHLHNINWTTIVEPTDTEDGYKEAICATCGHVLHINVKNNIQRSLDCLKFTLNEDGESYSTEIVKQVEGHIIFPSAIFGMGAAPAVLRVLGHISLALIATLVYATMSAALALTDSMPSEAINASQ